MKKTLILLIASTSSAWAWDLSNIITTNYSSRNECVYKESQKSSKTITPSSIEITKRYCDELVAKHLNEKCGFKANNVNEAIREGYSYAEIAEYLEKGCSKKEKK